jgi:hypothetical protein
MTNIPTTEATDGVPTYRGRGDPAGRFADYHPAWFDDLAEVRGTPVPAVHLITFNADGQARHIAAHYRPLSSLMFFSRLLRETLAGTPYAERFLAGEGERT